MKKQILNLVTFVSIGLAVVACKDKAAEAETTAVETATTAAASSVKYMASPTESVIEWTGYKPTGSHTGTILIDNGVFSMNGETIESGTFLINMASLKDSEASERLEGHLKSADFFEVETYPTAGFEVTGFEVKDGQTILSGNLALKDAKNNVSFPVTVNTEGDNISITSETFTIDRSKWNVKFKSKSFFSDLGEKFINDDIELKIMLKAKKS
jgi:polyisoprenoid-binding protein YceI